MDDLQAIHRLQRGDMSGLEALMHRYQVKAMRAAFLITRDEGLAQDVVQETFIRMYQRIHQFDETRPFEPYLMRSVVNASLNAVRDNSRFDTLEADVNKLEDLLDHAASVESQVEFRQLQQAILDALSRLSARQRAVIVQRYYRFREKPVSTRYLPRIPVLGRFLSKTNSACSVCMPSPEAFP